MGAQNSVESINNQQAPAAVPAFPSQAVFGLQHQATIEGGLMPGKNIYIQGVVNPNAHRFEINLCYRSGIAFHYNPRFDENLVVRNTLAMDNWGPEERCGGMPFHKGQNFQVAISCGPHNFSVFENRMLVHKYEHRFTKLQEINLLEIYGDLSMTSVEF